MKKLLILFIFFFRYTSYSQTAEQFYDSGLEKLQNGVYEDAIFDFNKAIEIDPNYAMAYTRRGAAKRRLKDYSGSIKDLNKAIELNPYNTLAYSLRGISKDRLGDKNGACEDFIIASSMGDTRAQNALKYFCN